jgi:hypothetical protein
MMAAYRTRPSCTDRAENASSSPMRQPGAISTAERNPKLTSLCEKWLGSAIGRRNRLPHHGKPSSYRTVGQAVSPVERLFTQTLTHGADPGARRSVLSRVSIPGRRKEHVHA